MPLRLRKLELADHEALCDAENAVFGEDSLLDSTAWKELELGMGWGYFEGETLVAYAVARLESAVVDILRLGVREAYRGQRLAGILLETIAFELSIFPRMLCVKKTNTRALRLYLGQKFEITGEIEDSWVMLARASNQGPLRG